MVRLVRAIGDQDDPFTSCHVLRRGLHVGCLKEGKANFIFGHCGVHALEHRYWFWRIVQEVLQHFHQVHTELRLLFFFKYRREPSKARVVGICASGTLSICFFASVVGDNFLFKMDCSTCAQNLKPQTRNQRLQNC